MNLALANEITMNLYNRGLLNIDPPKSKEPSCSGFMFRAQQRIIEDGINQVTKIIQEGINNTNRSN